MRLDELVGGIAGLRLERGRDVEIAGIAYHSEQVIDGDLFMAVPGFETDGHLYIDEAVRRGAAGVVASAGRTLPDALPERVANPEISGPSPRPQRSS